MKKIGLGGGCHWCTEGIFSSLVGVSDVQQGWIASLPPHESFSEAVTVTFDPGRITVQTLIHIHLLTHSSGQRHTMSEKYRSAVYYFDEKEVAEIQIAMQKLRTEFENQIITKVLPAVDFKLNRPELLNYFYTRPKAPFCTLNIIPKLSEILKTHAEYVDNSKLKEHGVELR